MRPTLVAVLFTLVLLTGGVLTPGCQPSTGLPFASEVDEPDFRRGKLMQRAGRIQEALESFTKVIDKRSGDAPESHFECGLIYLQHLKDPVAAIYHLRKYLAAQRPDAQQATRTRELIDTAMKEFARTLPAAPFEGQTRMLDLMETVDQLTKENYQLKEQIAQLRGVPLSSRPLAAAVAARPVPNETAGDDTSAEENEPAAAPAVPAPRPSYSQTNSTPPAAARVALPAAPSAGGRVHVVQKGESLFSISRQHYGNGSRVNDIVAANRNLLQDRNSPLKIGMQLKLP